MEVVRRRLVVHGHVQGVWFRESARRRALELGVSGWVRNRADGSVEAEVEGAADDVEVLVAWFGHGPSARASTASSSRGGPRAASRASRSPGSAPATG